MILLISAVFPPEPLVSASLSYDIAEELSATAVVKVLTPGPSRPRGFSYNEKYEIKGNFERLIMPSFTYSKSKMPGRLYESFCFGKHTSWYIKRNHSDIECIYMNSWPLLAQYLVVRTAKKYSVPVVLHVQDIYPESLSDKLPGLMKDIFIKLLLPLDKYTQKNSTKVVTISPGMKDFLVRSRNLDEKAAEVVFNWQNEESYIAYGKSANKENNNDCITFMFLGNLNRTAAINLVISAFINAEIKKTRLVIAGNGPERESLISLADCHRNADIEFCDAPKDKVPEIQDKADVLLLNLKQGAARFALPSKLSAYMFSARPVIACVDEDSDSADVIRQADCGWIVPPEDSEALVRLMKRVARMSKSHLRQLGRNGFKYAMEHFSKRRNLRKLTTIIAGVTKPEAN